MDRLASGSHTGLPGKPIAAKGMGQSQPIYLVDQALPEQGLKTRQPIALCRRKARAPS